jgi:LysR family transcriptional regulator for bpeEF and oprC
VSDRPVDLISDNVDCVIRGGELLEQSLVARRIANVRLVTVASPAYIRARHAAASERPGGAAHDGQLLFGAHGRPYPHVFEKDGESLEVRAATKRVGERGNAHIAAVLAGLGISQWPRSAAPHLASGELVPVLADWTRPPIPMHVVYPPNRHLSAKVRAFVEWAAELLAKHPRIRAAIHDAAQALQG